MDIIISILGGSVGAALVAGAFTLIQYKQSTRTNQPPWLPTPKKWNLTGSAWVSIPLDENHP